MSQESQSRLGRTRPRCVPTTLGLASGSAKVLLWRPGDASLPLARRFSGVESQQSSANIFRIVLSQKGRRVSGFMVARGHACTTADTQGSSPRIRLADIAERAMQRRLEGVSRTGRPRFPSRCFPGNQLGSSSTSLKNLWSAQRSGMTTSNLLHARCDPRQAGAAVVKLAVDVTER